MESVISIVKRKLPLRIVTGRWPPTTEATLHSEGTVTVLHVAYLFECEHFRAEAVPLVEAADGGDHRPVRERALATINRLRRDNQEWVLADPWSNPLRDVGRWSLPLTPDQVGFCFLVVLSAYVRPSPASLLGDWPVLHAALTALGWSARDAILLTKGQDTAALLRPRAVADPLRRPLLPGDSAGGDFALWMRSGYGDTGWLDTAQVAQLLGRLLHLRDELAHLETPTLRRDTYPTTGPYASAEQLTASYDHAVTMLAAAAQANSGLFMIVS